MRIFRKARAVLAESLVFDAANDAMLWCDITAGLIHRSPLAGAVDGSDDTVISLPAPVASFGLIPGGGFVVSFGDRVVLADARGTVTREVAVIAHPSTLMRLNEGKWDPFGRWVTGSMDLVGAPDGAFYAIDVSGSGAGSGSGTGTGSGSGAGAGSGSGSGSGAGSATGSVAGSGVGPRSAPVTVLAAGITTANGLEFSPSGDRIWFTDTGALTIYTAPYSVDGIGEIEPWHQGVPHDGLVRAADGSFFGALYGDGTVVHYDANARELARFEVPAPNVTSVAFDGDGVLYIASARENMTEEQLAGHPLSGSIFAIDPDEL